MTLILGLDVSKGWVVSCLLNNDSDSKPLSSHQARELYHTQQFLRVKANADGLRQLLAQNPDVAIIEPTGTNYSKLWLFQLNLANVSVRLVGHKQLKNFRQYLNLPDKDDRADALALALYYHEFSGQTLRFLPERPPVVIQLRDYVHRLEHLNRLQNPVINRLRQDLSWQFPECQNKSLTAQVFWSWLAGESDSLKYDYQLEDSVGLGLSHMTKFQAGILQQMRAYESLLQSQLEKLLDSECFSFYHRAMRDFSFGPRTKAALLSTIYPIQQFFDEDGKPENRKVMGSRRRFSKNRFLKALGVAPRREESGSSLRKTFKAGSGICRRALWRWVFVKLEVKKNRPHTPVCQALGALLDSGKASNRPVDLVRSSIASQAAKMLFDALVNELKQLE